MLFRRVRADRKVTTRTMSVHRPDTRRSYLRRVVAVVPRAHRRAVALVLVASAVAAGLEIMGAASILPFMALVMDPTLAAHPRVAAQLAAWAAGSQQAVLIAAGGVVGLILVA